MSWIPCRRLPAVLEGCMVHRASDSSCPDKKFPRNVRRFMEKVRHTMADQNMVGAGRAILVGVSGGPDSVALLHVLHQMADDLGLRLGIAHFHHNIRGTDADADVRFVENLSEKLNLPFYYEKNTGITQLQTGCSPEERLRDARYEFLQRRAHDNGFDRIAVGHHADDNAEQILINLLRGGGPLGISGIPPVRENIIRPLIRVSRDDIMTYLSVFRLDYRMDHTNTDRRFLRNRIRHDLMPMLKTGYNPNLPETLARLGSVLKTDNDWLDQLIRPIWDHVLLLEEPGRIVLSIPKLTRHHLAARRRIIRCAVEQVKGNLRRIQYLHVEAVIGLIQSGSPGRLDLPDRIRAHCGQGQLVFEKCVMPLRDAGGSGRPPRQMQYSYSFSIEDVSGLPVYISEIDRFLILTRIDGPQVRDPAGPGPHVAFFDWDRMVFPLVLRNHRPGDRFDPLGLNGTQKLSDFFINHKIGRRRRAMIPVLVSGADIIWVAGLRISHHVRITAGTRCLLRAEMRNPFL